MLLGDGKTDNWKLINYRQVGDLVTAEFLHDLYNQAMLDLNPVHFRNTVCVVENGEFRSFAPQKEWDYLAEVLGQKLTEDPDLRKKFSTYLERSQKDLTDMMERLQVRYADGAATAISPTQAFYDLSDLQYMALDRIYAINLVQFEHALGHALANIMKVPKEDVDKLLKSSELTISGQEEMRAIDLSLQVTKGRLTVEQAAAMHEKEFGGIKYAYGAERDNFDNHSKARIEELLKTSEDQRQQRLEALKTVSAHSPDAPVDSTVQELADLAKKLGERRDRNKALMGRVSGVRAGIMNKISEIGQIDRADLRSYFLKDIFDLLAQGKKLSPEESQKRKGRMVLQRQEREVYGVEAVSISENVLPSLVQLNSTNEMQGIVASSGIIRGKVRRVYTIEEARKVQNDEILVAYGTDFDLMIGLQNCAGVITEEGGLLSHASVISRELGKPCLINVKNAMSLLKDGDIIEINTDKAVVAIIARQQMGQPQNNDAIVYLEDANIESIKGAKAKNLHILEKAGLPVLPAVLVSVDATSDKSSLSAHILSTFNAKGVAANSFIVRSNTENEDIEGQSMAGQYESIVCRAENGNLAGAINTVLNSYQSTKVGQLNTGKDPGNTVLVQPYYAQQYGGVAFSHHPVTKESGVIVEASDKGAGAVVEGQKTLAEIPADIRKSVTEAVEKIEKILNCPVDVEWGYGADGLKIFQARPIVFKDAIVHEKKLIVIAGGEGSRIKEMFNDRAAPFTKHFLPLPEKGGSIIGAVIEKSREHFDVIEISASKNTINFATTTFAGQEKIKVTNDEKMIGPLGPPLLALLAEGKRVFACCGDVYSNFDWKEMESFHDKSGSPVSILVAKSFPAEKAACFNVDENGKIVGWDRKEKSTAEDYINIGGYIIDPSPEVVKIAQELIAQGKCKEDLFFEKCIEAGILSGFKEPGFSCNINTPDVYEALVTQLVEKNAVKNKAKPPIKGL